MIPVFVSMGFIIWERMTFIRPCADSIYELALYTQLQLIFQAKQFRIFSLVPPSLIDVLSIRHHVEVEEMTHGRTTMGAVLVNGK